MGETAIELATQRQRLAGLKTKGAGPANALQEAAQMLDRRVKGNLEPKATRGDVLKCPDTAEVVETFEGLDNAKMGVAALTERLNRLGVSLD